MKRLVALLAVVLLFGIVLLGCEPPAAPVASNLPPPPPAPPAPAPPPPEMEAIKAEVGVGIKGRSLDEYEGVVVTPAKTLFAVRERVVFDIQIPQALTLFNASEGRYPESDDEFMEKIVKFNNINLPKLPPEHTYYYDPETHELMVRRPKQSAAPSPSAQGGTVP
jgi:hypothetical protein